MINKLNAFLAELEKRGVQISGDAVFLCSDGAVLFMQNDRGGVNVSIVRNPIPIDYALGITDEDVENWRNTEEIFKELGGE